MHELTLELTNQCSNYCLHCSSSAHNWGSNSLKLYQIKEIINQHNPEWVNLSGGEPVLYSDLIPLIEWLKEKNIKIKLYTCGNYLDNHLYKLASCQIDKIIFSYYSCYQKLHEFITQSKDSHLHTLNSIIQAQRMFKSVEVHIVPMSITIHTLDKTIEQLITMGIKKISLLKLVNQGRCVENNFLLPESIEQVYKLKEKYSDYIRLGSPFDLSIPCTAGTEKLVVLSDGKIIPCESFKDGFNKCIRQ